MASLLDGGLVRDGGTDRFARVFARVFHWQAGLRARDIRDQSIWARSSSFGYGVSARRECRQKRAGLSQEGGLYACADRRRTSPGDSQRYLEDSPRWSFLLHLRRRAAVACFFRHSAAREVLALAVRRDFSRYWR